MDFKSNPVTQTSVIREALRISALVPNRSLLTADEPLQYKQWTLKPGVRATMEIPVLQTQNQTEATDTDQKQFQTAFCMNTSKYLLDASIYSDPTTFDPERWLGDPNIRKSFCAILRHFQRVIEAV
jgi:hypothetical protein